MVTFVTVGDIFSLSSVGAPQNRPDVAALSGGSVAVVFESADADSAGIFVRLIDEDGTPLGSNIPVNQTTAGVQRDAEVIALSGGGFVVAWEAPDGSDFGLFARIFDANGNPAGNEFRINAETDGTQDEVSLSAMSANRFSVTWLSDGSTVDHEPGVYYKAFTANGSTLVPDARLEPSSESSFTSYNGIEGLLSLSGGFKLALWEAATGTRKVYAQAVLSDGTLAASNFIVDDLRSSPIGAYQAQPFLTRLDNGNNIVTWREQTFDGAVFTSEIRGRRVDGSGNAIGDAFTIRNFEAGATLNHLAVALPGNGFLAIYSSLTGADTLMARAYNGNAEPLGEAFPLGSIAFGTAPRYDISALRLDNGETLLSWPEPTDDGIVIRARILDSGGAPTGEGFVLDPESTGSNTGVQLLELDGGRIIAIWSYSGPDGNQIRAQVLREADDPPGPTDGNDVLNGTPGNDSIDGLGGNDTINGKAGNDNLKGGAGNDKLNGEAGKDTLDGGPGKDVLDGGKGKDNLKGGDGKDKLIGGARNDKLTGGEDPDKFYFNTKLKKNVDKITDLQPNVDDIALDRDIFKAPGKKLNAGEFVTGKKAGDDDDYIIHDKGAGRLYYDFNGDKKGGQKLFATVDKNLDLDHKDFIMVA